MAPGRVCFSSKPSLNVILSKPSGAQIMMNPPYLTTEQPCHTFLFHVPGVLFRVTVAIKYRLRKKPCAFTQAPNIL